MIYTHNDPGKWHDLKPTTVPGTTTAEAAQGLSDFAKQWKAAGTTYGYDPASPSGDYGVTTIYEKPSRLRRLLRRLGIDKSTWQFRLKEVVQYENPPRYSHVADVKARRFGKSISNVKKPTVNTSEKDYS